MRDQERRPLAVVAAAVGALGIAWAGILVRLADVPPATSATFRCLLAVPVLGVVLGVHDARSTKPSRASRRVLVIAACAGLGLALRLLAWHAAIGDVGAGLAAVLVEMQVVVLPFLAWLLLRHRPHVGQFAMIPVVVAGCVLILGVGTGAVASNSEHLVRGVMLGVCGAVGYAAFQLALGVAARTGSSPVLALAVATVVSATATGAWGLVTSTLVWPSWYAFGWLALLAVGVQVVAWLLVTWAMLHVSAASVSALLVLHPLGTLLLGAVLLGERPSTEQLAGTALVLVGIVGSLVASERAARETAVTP